MFLRQYTQYWQVKFSLGLEYFWVLIYRNIVLGTCSLNLCSTMWLRFTSGSGRCHWSILPLWMWMYLLERHTLRGTSWLFTLLTGVWMDTSQRYIYSVCYMQVCMFVHFSINLQEQFQVSYHNILPHSLPSRRVDHWFCVHVPSQVSCSPRHFQSDGEGVWTTDIPLLSTMCFLLLYTLTACRPVEEGRIYHCTSGQPWWLLCKFDKVEILWLYSWL